MKIGIITIHNSPNYGACLQSYALWKYLKDLGHDVEIIDLYRPYQKEYVKSKRYKAYKKNITLKSLMSFVIRKFGVKKITCKAYSQKAFYKFDSFNSSMRFSKPYKSIDELYGNPPIYDLYISGSDQLWNPTQPYCLEPYFLTFVPEGKPKISFATSIGVTNLTKKMKCDYKKWLESYDDISVREMQGKELLESFIDRKIHQVADPTFLLKQSEWKSIASMPLINEPYILLFMLQHNQKILEYAQRISKESKKKLIYLCQVAEQNYLKDCIVINDAGIEEFLGYIAKADMVLTESFHGTVFSLLLGTKNFYAYIAANNGRGSRIEDLLLPFGLSDHILNNDITKSYEELSKKNVDIMYCTSIIEKQRKAAISFLNKHIGN